MTTPQSTTSLDEVMREALDEFQDEKLFKRMNSFVSTLQKVHKAIVDTRAFSRKIEGQDASCDDITHLKTDIELFRADTLLGDVKQGLEDEIESGKVSDAEKALKTLNIYCKLSIVVELVLIEFINYMKEEGPEKMKLPVFYHSFMESTRKQDKEYLEFLHFPKVECALAAAIYQHSPGKYPELRDYMKAIKVIPIPELGLKEGRSFYLTPKKWPNWYFYLSSGKASLIYGSEDTNDQNKFILRNPYFGEKGRVWRIENKYYPGYFLAARKTGSCMPLKHPDEVDYVEGVTMDYIRVLERDCRSRCVAIKKCSGCYSNCYSVFKGGKRRKLVSVNYQWKFTRLKSSGGCNYYFISATQENFGPGYTLFMKDSKNANAYLKYGNPKEQGMFKFSKSDCK